MRTTTHVVIGSAIAFAVCGCGAPGSPGSTAPVTAPAAASQPGVSPDARPATAAPERPPPERPPIDCGAAIPGAESLLAPGTVLLFGEYHGTAEIPAFVGALVCRAAEAGRPVRLGLEIKTGEQAAIDRYLASDGDDAARAALLAGPHWIRADQDGRSSEAMLALIDTSRRLLEAGRDVAVFAYDAEVMVDWNDRDRQMAAAILAHAQQAPDGLVITLSGSLHNRTVPGHRWDASAVPMGVHVKAGHARTVSLQPGFTGGSAWACTMSGCGRLDVDGQPGYAQRGIVLASDKPGQDGVFSVGAITASPPAIDVPTPK